MQEFSSKESGSRYLRPNQSEQNLRPCPMQSPEVMSVEHLNLNSTKLSLPDAQGPFLSRDLARTLINCVLAQSLSLQHRWGHFKWFGRYIPNGMSFMFEVQKRSSFRDVP